VKPFEFVRLKLIKWQTGCHSRPTDEEKKGISAGQQHSNRPKSWQTHSFVVVFLAEKPLNNIAK
jgi:hypothetical protein